MGDVKYINFPIKLIKELFEDKEKALSNILYYALYSHSLKLDKENSELHRFKSAVNFYKVNLNVGDQAKLNKGKALYNSIPHAIPKVGILISIFWDYYSNEKSDFQIACLASFLAIKSILGSKPYCKTDNAFLWARMSGNTKAIKDVSELTDGVKKFANDYQTVKIKDALRDDWGLVTYSRYTRGFYVSFTMDLKALIMQAETRRKSFKDKQSRQHEQDLVEQVLRKLNNTF